MGARQVAETDLEGLSTGRSDTSSVAADTRHGRGRPCDARGACWGGVTAASKLFSRRKTMVGWRNGTQRQIGDWPSLTSLIHHTKVRRYEGTHVHTYIPSFGGLWNIFHRVVYILSHVVYCNLQFFQQPWRSPIYSRPESELRRVHSLNCTRQFCALEA